MVANWPVADPALSFPVEGAEMEMVMSAIRAVRNRRAEMNVPQNRKCTLYVVTEQPAAFEAGAAFFVRLASADQVQVMTTAPEGAERMAAAVTGEAHVYMPMDQLVDVGKELQRIAKERAKAEKDLASIEKKLSNEGFLAKAPASVVAGEREKAEKLRQMLEQLAQSEARLQA